MRIRSSTALEQLFAWLGSLGNCRQVVRDEGHSGHVQSLL
jgi:hypothetical protein